MNVEPDRFDVDSSLTSRGTIFGGPSSSSSVLTTTSLDSGDVDEAVDVSSDSFPVMDAALEPERFGRIPGLEK